jgi:hypothetical protein
VLLLRGAALALGLWMVFAGGLLTRQEAGLVGARFTARDGQPGPLKASLPDVEAAHREFASIRAPSSDVADVELKLAIFLDHARVSAGFLGGVAREARLRSASLRLLRADPLSGDAWCMLAVLAAKSVERDDATIRERLSVCYAVAPREVSAVDKRLHLALALWNELPKDLQVSAAADIASALQSSSLREWMLDRLGYGIGVVAPSREPLVESLLAGYGDEVRKKFQRAKLEHRKQHRKRERVRR